MEKNIKNNYNNWVSILDIEDIEIQDGNAIFINKGKIVGVFFDKSVVKKIIKQGTNQ